MVRWPPKTQPPSRGPVLRDNDCFPQGLWCCLERNCREGAGGGPQVDTTRPWDVHFPPPSHLCSIPQPFPSFCSPPSPFPADYSIPRRLRRPYAPSSPPSPSVRDPARADGLSLCSSLPSCPHCARQNPPPFPVGLLPTPVGGFCPPPPTFHTHSHAALNSLSSVLAPFLPPVG